MDPYNAWCPSCLRFKCVCEEAAARSNISNCGAGIVVDWSDCRCGHSWYDHIGFRNHLEGEARLRTSCRIAFCRCAGYVGPHTLGEGYGHCDD